MTNPVLIKPRELAKMLGIATRTVSRWIDSGLVPYPIRKHRGMCVWRRVEIEAWIEAGLPTNSKWVKGRLLKNYRTTQRMSLRLSGASPGTSSYKTNDRRYRAGLRG